MARTITSLGPGWRCPETSASCHQRSGCGIPGQLGPGGTAMSVASPIADAFRCILANPTRGVVGLVDDLLVLCREHGLQLDWQPERCRLRPCGGDWEEVLDMPIRKSVFRTILARVAALCNERAPNSVSPYGGQGELSPRAIPEAVF